MIWRRLRWWHLAALAAALVLGAYMLHFAPGSGGLSPATEDWARFGEYVGGVFAILAFAGVLYTVELQRRQLKQLSEQAAVDELHRICLEIASNIDRSLDRDLIEDNPTSSAMNYRPGASTMRGILEKAANQPRSDDFGMVANILRDQQGPLIKRNMAIAGPELDLLANCIQDAQIQGGSIVILAYYRDRYSEIVRRMLVMGYELKSTEFWLKNTR
jgi:hypothetical protein